MCIYVHTCICIQTSANIFICIYMYAQKDALWGLGLVNRPFNHILMPWEVYLDTTSWHTLVYTYVYIPVHIQTAFDFVGQSSVARDQESPSTEKQEPFLQLHVGV